MSRWFRFYDDALNDPKVQRLPGDLFKSWVNILCIASKNGGVLPHAEDISFSLRIPEAKVGSILADLVARGLLDESENKLIPHNWNGRQHQSDSSTERVRAFRKRNETVSETVQNRTESETEQNRTEVAREARRKGTRISEDWRPTAEGVTFATNAGLSGAEVEREILRMRNHFLAKNGSGGVKLNWDRTWENWAMKACEILGRAPSVGVEPKLEPPGYYVEFATKEMDAWNAWEIKTKKNYPRDKRGGWRFPTQWPPEIKEDAA